MKRIIGLFGILIIGLFLVSGMGCSSDDVSDITKTTPNGNTEVEEKDEVPDLGDVVSTKVLVDRTRYVTGGKTPFDFTTVIFANEVDKGYKVEVDANDPVKVEVMTDKNCLLRGQGDEYETIQEKEGEGVVLVSKEKSEEDHNLCVGATAVGEGEIAIKFKVTELTY